MKKLDKFQLAREKGCRKNIVILALKLKNDSFKTAARKEENLADLIVKKRLESPKLKTQDLLTLFCVFSTFESVGPFKHSILILAGKGGPFAVHPEQLAPVSSC